MERPNKKAQNKEIVKWKKLFFFITAYVMMILLLMVFGITAMASSDPLTVVNNLAKLYL